MNRCPTGGSRSLTAATRPLWKVHWLHEIGARSLCISKMMLMITWLKSQLDGTGNYFSIDIESVNPFSIWIRQNLTIILISHYLVYLNCENADTLTKCCEYDILEYSGYIDLLKLSLCKKYKTDNSSDRRRWHAVEIVWHNEYFHIFDSKNLWICLVLVVPLLAD